MCLEKTCTLHQLTQRLAHTSTLHQTTLPESQNLVSENRVVGATEHIDESTSRREDASSNLSSLGNSTCSKYDNINLAINRIGKMIEKGEIYEQNNMHVGRTRTSNTLRRTDSECCSLNLRTNSSDVVISPKPAKRTLSLNAAFAKSGFRSRVGMKQDIERKHIENAAVTEQSVNLEERRKGIIEKMYACGSNESTKLVPTLSRQQSSTNSFLVPCSTERVHPTITVTHDSDTDSIYSDNLCHANLVHRSPSSADHIDYSSSKVTFMGKEASLFGSPKEGISMNGIETNGVDEDSGQTFKLSTRSYLKDQILTFFQPSDNKLAMKLFGNKNALMNEKLRHKRVGNWVIHPCSNFRFYWDLFMLVQLIANLLILPIAISFFNDDLSPHWIAFNCMSDTVFILDILINFRTGIIVNDFADEIILDPKQIARHYVKTWFILDFISSVPMDYIFLLWDFEGRAFRMLRLTKLLSLLRLLRLSRLVRYVQQSEEFLAIAGKFMRIFHLICLVLLLGHWNGCLQFLVPMLQDFPKPCWVAIEELQDATWLEQYTWSLFKALSHMLCIGYGRFPPQSMSDTWLTILSMLSGATCYALFLAHITTLIQSFDTSRRLYNEKFKQVEEYMIYRKLPRSLRQRITDYYEHRYQGKMFDEATILSELNDCLHFKVVNHNCRALVAAVPFFTNTDPSFVSEVVSRLKFEVYQPGDFVITEGMIGTHMYFIQEGIVDIITSDGEVATSLSDGSYFGEICLLTNTRRVASVRAETYVNLYTLRVDHFNDVLERYPLMRRTMESVAAERLSKIGKNPSLVSSRADLEEDQKLVNEIVMESNTIPTSESDEDDGESGDSSDELRHKKRHFKFDFRNRLHKISNEEKSRSRDNVKHGNFNHFREHNYGNIWAMLPKVQKNTDLHGLEAPGAVERMRSGSVGDACGVTHGVSGHDEDAIFCQSHHHAPALRRASDLDRAKSFEVFDDTCHNISDSTQEPNLRAQDIDGISLSSSNAKYLAIPRDKDKRIRR